MSGGFMKLAEERYSVRKFQDKKIDKKELEEILKAGHIAPTACNIQPQRILVIESDEALEKLKECTKCHFDAPLALLVGYSKSECWKRRYDGKPSGDIDASIVTTHMMLAAQALGIGSTWVMHFDPEKMRKAFNVPEDIEMTALLVMGYPHDEAEPYEGHSTFRSMDEVVRYDSF